LAAACAVIGILWAVVVVLNTIMEVRGAYFVSAVQASRLYNEATMGLAGLAVVTLGVMLLVQTQRRS
jgi:hypothetical protein